MRILKKTVFFSLVVCLTVEKPVVLAETAAVEEETWDAEDDADLTVADDENLPEIDDNADDEFEAPPEFTEDSSLAEEADADLTESQRKMRMAMCFGVARQKFVESKDEMEKAVEMVKSMHNIEEDQAREMIHVNMIKNCYINLNQEEDLKIFTNAEYDIEQVKETMNRLVGPSKKEQPGKQSTLADRHWNLIREIVEEERNRQQSDVGKIEVLGSKMSPFNKFLYFVAVFGAIFCGGYVLVKKLMQIEAEKAIRRRTKKGASREPSAELRKTQ